jgi:hypothetical protein
MSYPDQGEPMDVKDHPSYNVPQATEHYAGDTLPTVPSPSLAPMSSYEQFNVSHGQGKMVGPLPGKENIWDPKNWPKK